VTGPDGPDGEYGLIYLLCFDDWYVPYPGAPLYCCAKHYTGNPRVQQFSGVRRRAGSLLSTFPQFRGWR
jgi:hypothetical protein